MQSFRFFIKPLIVFAIITAACAAILTFGEFDWSKWTSATCYPHHCFCEKLHAGNVRQPMNTWSNLSFVLVGLLLFGVVARDRDPSTPQMPSNPLNENTGYTTTLGISIVLIGVTSLFYHASLSFLGQWFDVMSMYLLANFAIIYNMARLGRLKTSSFVMSYIGVNAACGYVQYALPEFRRYLFGLLLVVALISIVITRRKITSKIDTRYLYGSLGAFVAAFGIWILDIKGILCWPESLFQGHAVWHIICAVASGFLYLYYRSEHFTEKVR